MPNAGALRRLVALQTSTQTPDADGGFVETWTTANQLWAEFDVPSASNVERVIGGELQTAVNYVVRSYYDARATTEARLLSDGRIYDIVGVRDIDDRHQWMELAVVEHV